LSFKRKLEVDMTARFLYTDDMLMRAWINAGLGVLRAK